MIPKSWRANRSPSGDGKEARRRVPRVVGVGVGLLRHDGEVEGVVVKDDAVMELCVRGRDFLHSKVDVSPSDTSRCCET